MKMIAAANYDFESQTENGYVDAYNSDFRLVALLVINLRAKKRNVDESLIDRL